MTASTSCGHPPADFTAVPGAPGGHGWAGAAARAIGWCLMLLVALLGSRLLDRPLDYDEAIYLNIAKAISRTGLPYYSCREDLGRYALFVDSPPLVTLFAASTQRLWPYAVRPSRALHMALFLAPLFYLVWHIGCREYGRWPACFSLLVLLGNPLVLLYGSCIRLDVPLALFTLLALWAFCKAIGAERGRNGWSWIGAGALAAAVWTKYQAVCIPATILVYLGWLFFRGQHAALRRAWRPLGAMAVAGAAAAAGLYLYLYALPAPSTAYYQGGLAGNLSRFVAPAEAWTDTLWRLVCVGVIAALHLGWPGAAACAGALAGRARSGFAPMLVCLGAVTLLFNLAAFRLPGAGAWYLTPLLPALALLAGRAAAASLLHPQRVQAAVRIALIGACVFLPFRAFPVWDLLRLPEAPDPVKQVADYIGQHSDRRTAVLADSFAIEFYTDRPTAPLQFTSHEMVLKYLSAREPYRVEYVVVPQGWMDQPPATLSPIWRECRALLDRHFQTVPMHARGLVVYRRIGA